jgi:hypothetical protein
LGQLQALWAAVAVPVWLLAFLTTVAVVRRRA